MKKTSCINKNRKMSIIPVGYLNVMVVDNFLAEPVAIRRFALDSYKKTRQKGGKIQGKFEVKSHANRNELWVDFEYLEKKFAGLHSGIQHDVEHNLGADIRKHYAVSDTAILRPYRTPFFNATYKANRFLPHVDPGHVSSFLYLNSPEQCVGGTAVYRHIPTDTLHLDQATTILDDLCQIPLTEHLTESTEEWKLEHRIDMKFNRLVSFNASAIHKIYWPKDEQPFNDRFSESRLTLNNGFNYVVEGR